MKIVKTRKKNCENAKTHLSVRNEIFGQTIFELFLLEKLEGGFVK